MKAVELQCIQEVPIEVLHFDTVVTVTLLEVLYISKQLQKEDQFAMRCNVQWIQRTSTN